MEIGKSIPRVDAFEKVTGRAKYVEDYMPKGALTARVLHSDTAHGIVKSIDLSQAEKIPGVLKICTCFDVPDIEYATAAGAWQPDPGHRPVADRKILNSKVRFVGDDIAAVVAEDEISAARALRAIRVTYEELPAVFEVKEAMAAGAPIIHEGHPDNIVRHTSFGSGNYEEAISEAGLAFFEGSYRMPAVLHSHIEPASSGAYMENGRIVIVTGTMSIFSVQRQTAAALGLPWDMVKVVKPYVGGSFGNRQDVLYEALAAFLTMQAGGRPVWVKITQEETMRCTRSRHDIEIRLESGVRADGKIVSRGISSFSNQGGYASQGHNIASSSVNVIRQLYPPEKGVKVDAYTVYTNRIVGGAMRGYGSFQGIFAVECHMEDIALARGEDPCEFRLKNILKKDFQDPVTKVIFRSIELADCIKRGRKLVNWDKKRAEYSLHSHSQYGSIRRGIGMAACCYKNGGYPSVAETAVARVTLGQDGMVTLLVGAVDVGQGTETVLSQIAADATGIPVSMVRIAGVQDTDISPYDNGAYGSRQTYITGNAVKRAGELLREKILSRAEVILGVSGLDMRNGVIVSKDGENRKKLLELGDIAKDALFNHGEREQLSAESTFCCRENPLSTAACFAEIEVDLSLGRIKVLDIVNVHDSGVIIHPKTAVSQVQGAMGMSLGCAMLEQVIYDEKGVLLNNNMLDYKIPTAMDLPDLQVEFVDSYEPTGPYGNKSLGESPIMVPVAAVRNALLHATGIAFNDLPMSPQRLTERLRDAGFLVNSGGAAGV